MVVYLSDISQKKKKLSQITKKMYQIKLICCYLLFVQHGSVSCQNSPFNKKERTSNDILAEDGKEWFMIEYKF